MWIPRSSRYWGSRRRGHRSAWSTGEPESTRGCPDGDGGHRRASTATDEYDAEHRMVHKDGSVRWFLSRGSLVRHGNGTPHRFVGTKVDITERKRAEEAIREKEAALRSSDRQIQHLAGRLIAAQEVERARVARIARRHQPAAGRARHCAQWSQASPGSADGRRESAGGRSSLQQRASRWRKRPTRLTRPASERVGAHRTGGRPGLLLQRPPAPGDRRGGVPLGGGRRVRRPGARARPVSRRAGRPATSWRTRTPDT